MIMSIRTILISLVLSLTLSVKADAGTPGFREYCARLAEIAARENKSVIAGNDGWLFLVPELRHIGHEPFRANPGLAAVPSAGSELSDPLPAILDFHAQLATLNVKLLIVPVPPKCLIFSDKLPLSNDTQQTMPTPPSTDPVQAGLTESLRKHDVTVLDLSNLFRQNRDDPNGAPYCKTDSHWSGNGCVLAGTAIAEIIRQDLTPAENFIPKSKWIEITARGDLTRMPGSPDTPDERLRLRRVERVVNGKLNPITPGHKSQVILLGDSHNLIFHAGGDMHSVSAGLPDQLALELGQPVELVAVRGAGATPARVNLYRRAAGNPEYWHGRKWVVWCFAAREFTEGGAWRKVPIKPE